MTTLGIVVKTIIDRFWTWRRSPYKQVIMRAYADGIITSRQMHWLAARIDNAR